MLRETASRVRREMCAEDVCLEAEGTSRWGQFVSTCQPTGLLEAALAKRPFRQAAEGKRRSAGSPDLIVCPFPFVLRKDAAGADDASERVLLSQGKSSFGRTRAHTSDFSS